MSEPQRATRGGLVRLVLGMLGAAFVVYAGYRLLSSWDGGSIEVSLPLALLGLLPALASMFLQWAGWRSLVTSFSGVRLAPLSSAIVYVDSQLARYTPGKLGLLAVRVAGARSLGVRERVMVTTLLLETLSWAVSGTSVSLLGATLLAPGALHDHLERAGAGGVPASMVTLLVLLGLSGLVVLGVLCVVRRRRLPSRVLQLIGSAGANVATEDVFVARLGDEDRPLIPWLLPLCHLAHWMSWVLVGSCLASALGAGWLESLWLGAVICLAIVAGFVAFLAPAGAGVREAVIAVVGVPVLGASGALAFGILGRGVSLLSEVMIWGALRALRSRSSRREAEQ